MLRLFVIGVLSLMGCSRAVPCAPEDVDLVAQRCRVEPSGSPTYRACLRARLPRPESFSFLPQTVEACTRRGSGATFACLAARSEACVGDGGAVDFDVVSALAASCQASGGVASSAPTEACEASCETARRACEDGCPTPDWNTCAACSEACAVRFTTCTMGC